MLKIYKKFQQKLILLKVCHVSTLNGITNM